MEKREKVLYLFIYMKANKVIITAYLLVVMMLFAVMCGLAGCAKGEDAKHTRTMLIMDTQVNITYYHPSAQVAQTDMAAVFAEMERLENILSRHVVGSDINRINEAAGLEAVQVSEETLFVLRRALDFADLSGGAFDPTVAPLLEAWGFSGDAPAVPAQEDLEQARELVNYGLVEINEEKGTVFLPVPGMRLDLGGIAKGYIVDMGQELTAQTASASFINAGGDISVQGRKPNGEDWRIGVQDPREPERLAAIINMDEGSVATSGDYQRYFEAGGYRYHHIIDPYTGMPAGELTSVTVVAGDTLTADALSTAIFVLGEEKGMAMVERLPGAEAIIINKNGDMVYTEGLEGKVEIIER